MVTIKDVAAHAGVSTATVSYVLNGQGSIPAETQRRVWESVTTLQYHPRHAARAMRGRSHTLGVSIARGYDRLADPTAAEVLAGMADAASQRGLSLLLIPRTDDPAAGCVQVARSGQVDGVVLFDLHALLEQHLFTLSGGSAPDLQVNGPLALFAARHQQPVYPGAQFLRGLAPRKTKHQGHAEHEQGNPDQARTGKTQPLHAGRAA